MGRSRIKRNIKYIFRLITRRRVLGMLGLFGGFTYSFLDTPTLIAGVGVEKRSVGTPPIQKFFKGPETGDGSKINEVDQKLVVDEYEGVDHREECPYETDLLSKFF